MFPINFIEMLQLGFGKPVLELAAEQGAGVLAIKPMCRGSWPEGVERTRKWWYRPVEEAREVALALRFTLSQPGVVAGFPPAFVDLLDKAIEAAQAYRAITEGTVELGKIAKECISVFRKEEAEVARGMPPRRAIYPGSPHEGCPGIHV